MAKDEVYELAVAKGSRLLRMMLTNDSEAGPLLQPPQNTAQSVFTSAQDLAKYGYTQLPWDPRVGEGALDGLAPAFEAIGVDAKLDQDEGKNVVVDHKHSQACTIDGIQYRATNAFLTQICNTTDGVLIALANQSAPHIGRFESLPVPEVPPLHHWSDIAYLQWLKTSTSASSPVPLPAPIKFVLRLKIQNVDTYSILNKITARHGLTGYPPWPGIVLDIESDEGKAVLGTPNGAGVAWLLIQRKKELGHKRVEKVTFFCVPSEGEIHLWASLLFWIV